ncbi:hypothetical protein J6590_076837 [Homalodisca vitripennis]|nr:hypothetical protein J6590_076837 [Homalodisca vitripennis]
MQTYTSSQGRVYGQTINLGSGKGTSAVLKGGAGTAQIAEPPVCVSVGAGRRGR